MCNYLDACSKETDSSSRVAMMEDNLRCRLCSKAEETTSLIDVLDKEEIRAKINSYLSLEVKKHDSLSTSICILCYGKLDNFHNFVVSIRKVQDELASTTKNEETHSSNGPVNGDEPEEDPFTYQDFESEAKYDPDCDMQIKEEIPIKKSRKRRSALGAKPTRKSTRLKPVSEFQSTKKDACIQAGNTLATDLEDLKSNSSLQLQNLEGLEILALLPARLRLGCSVSQDSETNKSCLAKLNLGVKTKNGDILIAPNSDSNSKQLIKLPPPRISE